MKIDWNPCFPTLWGKRPKTEMAQICYTCRNLACVPEWDFNKRHVVLEHRFWLTQIENRKPVTRFRNLFRFLFNVIPIVKPETGNREAFPKKSIKPAMDRLFRHRQNFTFWGLINSPHPSYWVSACSRLWTSICPDPIRGGRGIDEVPKSEILSTSE